MFDLIRKFYLRVTKESYEGSAETAAKLDLLGAMYYDLAGYTRLEDPKNEAEAYASWLEDIVLVVEEDEEEREALLETIKFLRENA